MAMAGNGMAAAAAGGAGMGDGLRLRLRRFANQCARCGAVFTTWHQSPHDYGLVHFATRAERFAVVDGLESPDWAEITALVDRVAARWRLDTARRDRLLRDAMESALDPAPGGEPWGMWGAFPCPVCGWRIRARFEPASPVPVYEEKAAEAASFARWHAATPAAREGAVEGLVLPAS